MELILLGKRDCQLELLASKHQLVEAHLVLKWPSFYIEEVHQQHIVEAMIGVIIAARKLAAAFGRQIDLLTLLVGDQFVEQVPQRCLLTALESVLGLVASIA